MIRIPGPTPRPAPPDAITQRRDRVRLAVLELTRTLGRPPWPIELAEVLEGNISRSTIGDDLKALRRSGSLPPAGPGCRGSNRPAGPTRYLTTGIPASARTTKPQPPWVGSPGKYRKNPRPPRAIAPGTYYARCVTGPRRWTDEDEAIYRAGLARMTAAQRGLFVTDVTPPILRGRMGDGFGIEDHGEDDES